MYFFIVNLKAFYHRFNRSDEK